MVTGSGFTWRVVQARLIVAVTLVLASAGLAAADLSIVGPEYFMDIPDKYDSMPFDVGPTKTIESPDAAVFRTLVIPVYEGLPRLGVRDSYLVKDTTKNEITWKTKQERTAVTKRLKEEVELYLSMLAIRFGGEHVNAENVKFYKPDAPMKYYTHRGYAPRSHITAVARGLTTASAYEEFFCADAAPCTPGRGRLAYFTARSVFGMQNAWGGNSNEFGTRAAVEKFVTSHLQTMIDWSATLSPDVAIVEMVELGDYDFEKGGFHLRIKPPLGSGSFQHRAFQYYQTDESSIRLEEKFGTSVAPSFLAMGPDEAERLLEELKRDYGQRFRPMVYFVIKGRFFDLGFRQQDFGGAGSLLLYELSSDTVGIFKDESLTQRIADVKLNRKRVGQ